MTTKYIDDVTGEEYADDWLDEFGLLTHGDLHAKIDVHTDTWVEDPQAVADELHKLIDEWVEDMEQEFDGEEEQ